MSAPKKKSQLDPAIAVPDGNHIVVHLLELPLGHLDGVRRGVQLVGLEALIAKGDGKGLVLGLQDKQLAWSRNATQRPIEHEATHHGSGSSSVP